MRKDALTITITTAVLGIFGAFFRWLQKLNAFEKDTGLAVPGAGTSVAFVVYTLAAIAAIAVMTWLWMNRRKASAEPACALDTGSVVPAVLGWAFAAVTVIAALALMFSADASRSPMFQRVFSAAAIFWGLSLPFLMGKKGSGEVNPMGALAALIAVAFGCLWIVFSYKVNSENPVVWAYCVEILAIAAATLAFYCVAAYYYGRAKPVTALFMCQSAALLNMSTLTDERSTGLMVIHAVCAGFMLMTEYILVSNLKDE